MPFALRFYKFSGEETADSRCHGVPRRSRGAAIWMETESGGGVERRTGDGKSKKAREGEKSFGHLQLF